MSYIFALLCIILATTIPVFGVVVEVPPPRGNPDIAVTGPARIQADEFTVFSFIQLINEYLRFAMGAIALGLLIYGGMTLMTAQGNPEELAKAHKILLGTGVGIMIIIFSYAIVRIIVNLL